MPRNRPAKKNRGTRPFDFIHFEDSVLISLTALLTEIVRDRRNKRCTWSATPPIFCAGQLIALQVPAM